MAFNQGDYVEVSERIREFYAKYPEGSLQPQDIYQPVRVTEVGDRTFLTYTALAFRTPDDTRPGVGVAWEPFPGTTPYTKNSEAMNAETSAWGRAIAALGIATKKGIATHEEVQNRQQQAQPKPEPQAPVDPAHITPRLADEKPPPDEKLILAQDLAIMAFKIAENHGSVDELRREVYEPAKSARILRTQVVSPFDEQTAQLSAIITYAKTQAGKGWPEGSVGEAAQK